MSHSDPRRVKIGILVPSSNTALEPLTNAILNSIPSSEAIVTAHFSRFPVTKIALSDKALAQFDPEKILFAAQLLADAKVDIIGWSGTSSGWLGFEADEDLCRQIEKRTGIQATTSVLALNKALKKIEASKLGLVTPYVDDVQAAIIKNYAAIGIDASAERHLRQTNNVMFASLDEKFFDRMVEGVVKEGARVVSTFCTNMSTAQHVDRWERDLEVTVLDTVTTVLWDALRLCKVRTETIKGWGSIMNIQ
ncbi:Asp/Glu/hydantoin racemase [Aaosphaeria arxii CBS 175.79]|uniref:Asp/Glu/hydantoin racemase n=1 Tax=Aaosphaeria arxii CBS 175.79 TaxID=1450172 RepID=A0A6A5XIX4_9PLEO|nr:Asp/Glu/hydantoin racemase [Aaosphaeria arxii CBS 175.79]KAF2012816.1 Asp/Glu/hydantoin racemase [Aaosphaeria arxii CBS 175.79]